MRPVDKSRYTANQQEYDPFGSAKDDLIAALGDYCSYCERIGYFSALDVEHVKDKSSFPALKLKWDNFILACKNCNSTKLKKSVVGCMLPHIDDTYAVFDYLEGGLVVINPELSAADKNKAELLVALVGLDRRPGVRNYSTRDRRWQERTKAWNLAERYLKKYQLQQCDLETLLDLAFATGFWSVWMKVFAEHKEVQVALVTEFNGTRLSCFESLLS